MTIYESLDEIRRWVAQADWDGLEAEFNARCARVAPSIAGRIAAVELESYEADLGSTLDRLSAAGLGGAKAIYWEFNPDDRWQSAFFRCRSYQAEAMGDEEWASDFDESSVIAGPTAPELAAVFASDWDRSEESVALNCYLVARTIAALGRASSTWQLALPLCAGYHDQDVLYRVRGE